MGDVSIQEAATRLGVSTETIRRRLHKGVLKGQQVTTPQGFMWTVELPDEEPQHDGHSDGCADLRDMVAMLQAQVEADREELGSKNKQIEQLHVLLQQQALALPAPTENRHSWWRFWER